MVQCHSGDIDQRVINRSAHATQREIDVKRDGAAGVCSHLDRNSRVHDLLQSRLNVAGCRGVGTGVLDEPGGARVDPQQEGTGGRISLLCIRHHAQRLCRSVTEIGLQQFFAATGNWSRLRPQWLRDFCQSICNTGLEPYKRIIAL